MRRVALGILAFFVCSVAVAAEEAHRSPVYLNWEFWSAICAGLALVLSQFPPVATWLKPRRLLEVETLSRIVITHKIGNPNLGLYVSVRNGGKSDVRVRSMNLAVKRDEVDLGTFPAQNYYETMTSKETTLFVAFSIKPGETWAHTVNFLRIFDRGTEKWYRQSESKLRENIQTKIAARDASIPEKPKTLIEAEPELVQPFLTFFDKNFAWFPGEYFVNLTISTDYSPTAVVKKFRFTLYESDSNDLRSLADDYKYAAGINWDRKDRSTAFFIPIVPVDQD
jgi:hypothetical protein